MRRVLMLSVSLAVITWGDSRFGLAQPLQLSGPYGFTGSSTCIKFNQFLESHTEGPVVLESFTVVGTAIFNSDGTGNESGDATGVEFNTSSLVGFRDDFNYQFSFTYQGGAGFWASMPTPGSVWGEMLWPGPHQGTFTITNFPGATGTVSQNGTLLAVTQNQAPLLETVTYANGDIVRRICAGSRVYASRGS